MKKFTTLKTLLVGLLAVGATNVWADGNKRVIASQNYESATAADWTSPNGTVSFKTGDATYGNYVQCTPTGSGNRNCYKAVSYDFEPNGYTTADMATEGYNIEFDIALVSGNVEDRSVSQFIVPTVGPDLGTNTNYTGTDYIFSLSNSINFDKVAAGKTTDKSQLWYVNDLTNATETTVTLDEGWYHVKMVVTSSSVASTISRSGEAVVTDTKEVTSLPVITGIWNLLGRGSGSLKFDNLEIYDFTATKEAVPPTFTLKSVSGANRIYTLTNSNGEGKLYYTTSASESAPEVGDAAYSSTSDASIDITISEAGNYYAYTVLSDESTTSTVTAEESVVVGEITLPTPTFAITALDAGYTKTYTITAANNVLLTPTVKLSYVFTPEGGSEQASVDMTGNTINATEAGVYVVTSSAEGYTSSSVTIENNTAYKLVNTIDFSALTDSDFGSLWENATVGLRDYWNQRAAKIPTDVVIKKVIDPTAETTNTAVDGITLTDLNRQPQIVIGYGLYTPYDALSGNGNNCNFIVTDGTEDQLVVYQGWNNYGNGNFTTVQTGTATFALYRYDTILKTIKVYAPMTEEFEVVTIGAAGYATFCSDKALDFTDITDLTAYTANISGTNVKFEQVTGTVPANTGLLVKGISTNIPVVSSAEEISNAFIGVTEATEIPAGSFVLMNDGEKGLGFYKTTSTFTVGANTAYIPAQDNAREFIAINGEATAIKAVETKQQNGEIYNLAGQRVNKAQKGLYIQNGKKVIIK